MVKALAREFEQTHPETGLTYYEILASMVRDMVIYGSCNMLTDKNGETKQLILSPNDVLGMIKWTYNRIEGTPAQEIRHESMQTIYFDTNSILLDEEKPLIEEGEKVIDGQFEDKEEAELKEAEVREEEIEEIDLDVD